jgi:hypothetical protein
MAAATAAKLIRSEVRAFHQGPKRIAVVNSEAEYMTAAYHPAAESLSCNTGRTIYGTHVSGLHLREYGSACWTQLETTLLRPTD